VNTEEKIMTKRAKKSRKSGGSGQGGDPLVRSAVKLIDQAAALLKRGVIAGAHHSAGARHTIKVKASSLVGQAADKLQVAIDEGASALRKGLKKL
jgi:hypothetical protein